MKPIYVSLYLCRIFVLAHIVYLSACGGNTPSTSSSQPPVSSSTSSLPSSSSQSGFPAQATPLPPAVTRKVVRFAYFVEADAQFSQRDYDAVKNHAYAMQQYWYEQFGGTFYLYGDIVDVIYGDKDAEWYVNTPDGLHSDPRWYRLGNIKNEVYRKLSIRDFDPQVRVINYPTTRYDGRVGANFGGAWMDGDDLSCLSGEHNGYNFPYDDQNPAHCVGHVVHEFGHVFGLDHTGPSTDCMQYGFYISSTQGNMCNFSADNRNTVKESLMNSGWLQASPGEVISGSGQLVAQ